MDLTSLMKEQLIIPFVREYGYAVRSPWKMGERRLLDYLLIYIQQGTLQLSVEGVSYTAVPGQFVLIQPDCTFSMEGKTSMITPFVHMDIFYHPERESGFTTRDGMTDIRQWHHLIQPRLDDVTGIRIPVVFTPSQPVVFRDMLLKLVGVSTSADPLLRLEAQNLASDLILHMLKDYWSRSSEPTTGVDTSKKLVNWVSSYILAHYTEPLSVAEMAAYAGYSESHFSALFRQSFGVTPHQYVLKLRIQHARKLLRHIELTIDQIALLCGFKTVHHFSHTFKKMTGVTPGDYRNTVRET